MKAGTKKALLIGGLALGGLLAYKLYQNHQAGGGGSSSRTLTPDLAAVLNRQTPQVQAAYINLLKTVSNDQFAMLDSIAHSWNNGIPLTDAQAQLWGTIGVF